MAIITLLTDFGLDNWFVGTMKGVIKGINPEADVVDICHAVERFNVREGAFVLLNAYGHFPEGTIHVAVVDPGVGSERAALVIKTPRYHFVGPDNGLFSYVLDREPAETIVRITNEEFLLTPVSGTFHGRDVFAPVSARLSLGVPATAFGPVVERIERFQRSQPGQIAQGEYVGHVLYVDLFGNLITDVPVALVERLQRGGKAKYLCLRIRDHQIRRIATTYAEAKPGELIAVPGSSGFLEIAVRDGSARGMVDIGEGGEFVLKVL